MTGIRLALSASFSVSLVFASRRRPSTGPERGQLWCLCLRVRWCGTEQGSQKQLVSRPEVEQACGDVAKGLKDYQLVGINFMMLLKRSNVRPVPKSLLSIVFSHLARPPHCAQLSSIAAYSPCATLPWRPFQIPGVILADEMGLGKTAQTICFLGLLSTLEVRPVL